MDVTTTASGAGKFETRFYNMVMENEFGRVKGHFGPVHTLAFSPDGHRWEQPFFLLLVYQLWSSFARFMLNSHSQVLS